MENRSFATHYLLPLLTTLIFGLITLSGCGRYGPPLPPEAYSPASVENLEALPIAEGVVFNWRTPQKDRQGEDIEELSHYDIMRTTNENLLDFLKDPIGSSEVVGRVYSKEQELMQQKKAIAREKKESTRTIELPDSFSQHTFTDRSLSAGTTYLYSIVPYGRDGIAGEVSEYPKVTFNGELSAVELLTQRAFDRPYLISRESVDAPREMFADPEQLRKEREQQELLQ